MERLFREEQMILKDFNKKWNLYLEQKGAKPRTISFDFDDTLIQSDADYNYEGPNKFTVSLFKKFKEKGFNVIIVTSRMEKFESDEDRMAVRDFVKEMGLKPDGIYFTEGKDKAHLLKNLGVMLHFDDDEYEWAALEAHAPDINVVKIDYRNGKIFDGFKHIMKLIGI